MTSRWSPCCCLITTAVVTLIAIAASVQCSPWQAQASTSHHHQSQQRQHQPRTTLLAARRAADDSRPLLRVASPTSGQVLSLAEGQINGDQIVVGKFRAPAPEQIHQQRVAKSSRFASQTMSASYRVANPDSESAASDEKVVHGIAGSSMKPQSIQRTVGAKIMVSDEGLSYPPSKLSADIYGNVAEIVTAPPEAVDSDFLYPKSSRFSRP